MFSQFVCFPKETSADTLMISFMSPEQLKSNTLRVYRLTKTLTLRIGVLTSAVCIMLSALISTAEAGLLYIWKPVSGTE